MDSSTAHKSHHAPRSGNKKEKKDKGKGKTHDKGFNEKARVSVARVHIPVAKRNESIGCSHRVFLVLLRLDKLGIRTQIGAKC